MWNGIKTGFMMVVFMLLALFTSWIVSHAFNLMNKPSDFLVLIGVDLLLLLFLFWFILTWTAIQTFRKWWRTRKMEGKRIPSLTGMLLLAVLSSSWISGCTWIAPGYVGINEPPEGPKILNLLVFLAADLREVYIFKLEIQKRPWAMMPRAIIRINQDKTD